MNEKKYVNTSSPISPLSPLTISSLSPSSPLTNNDTKIIKKKLKRSNSNSNLDINTNQDSKVKYKMIKYFVNKTYNKWIFNDFNKLNKYLVLKKNNIEILKNKKEYKKNKGEDSLHIKNLKREFIKKNILSKNDIKKLLKMYVLKSDIKWNDLLNYNKSIKELIYKTIKSELKN